MKNKVTLHRIIKTTPEKVFRAFTDAKAMQFWIPPFGFLCEIHHFEPKVGGTFRMSFINFSTQKSHSFGGKFLEITQDKSLKYTDVFEDENLQGEMTTTVQLKEVICGTELQITQEGIPAVIPLEMCYLGWQESLEKLIKLVEPTIPDN